MAPRLRRRRPPSPRSLRDKRRLNRLLRAAALPYTPPKGTAPHASGAARGGVPAAARRAVRVQRGAILRDAGKGGCFGAAGRIDAEQGEAGGVALQGEAGEGGGVGLEDAEEAVQGAGPCRQQLAVGVRLQCSLSRSQRYMHWTWITPAHYHTPWHT